MWIELIFYLAFVSQILLISCYYPKRILERMDFVFKHCPFETHKKLYPKGYEKTLEGKVTFKVLNRAILVIGVLLLTVFFVGTFNGTMQLNKINLLPMAYGLLQAIPFFIIEISALKQFKLMRNLNSATKRQADLNPRSLFNYVSPVRFYAAVIMFFVCSYIIFSFNDFEVSFDVAVLMGSMLLCNGLFVGLGYTLLHGKKLDPHQSPKDRHIMTTAAFHSYTSVSILVSVFFILNRSVDHYALDDWEALFNSLYWQVLMLVSTGAALKLTNLEKVNYDVYKTTS
ncbi:hypothetical protein [Paraglaciecola arctica]|uniref:Uncharacterized protein n=1 Tax=Paraglaciecola arctica BSs20135 TaxID=493475 RepID=K6XNW1_9ALTE|nr:hypothetical protein [Paraglaciecola arctica]GAC22304.1 hypothetical protein GARC_5369 [Paraglaciecola arctica BSs20135]